MKIATKIAIIMLTTVFSSVKAAACPQCRAAVQDKIVQSDFTNNLFVLTLPLLILGTIGIGIFYADELKKKLQKGARNGKK